MSCFLDVPFYCFRHPDEKAKFIDLKDGVEKEMRLLCQKCIGVNQMDLQAYESVFQFLSETKMKYGFIQQDIQRIKNLFLMAKLATQQFFENIEEKIQQFEKNIESKKLIKDDAVEEFSERQPKYSLDKLATFLEILSKNTKIVKDENKKEGKPEIKFKQPYFSESDKKFRQQLEKKLKDLLELCKLPEFKIESETKFAEGIAVLEFNKSGELLAVGSQQSQESQFVSIWRVNHDKQWTLVKKFEGHQQIVKSICFSHKNDSFVTGSNDTNVIYWEQIGCCEWKEPKTFYDNQLTVNCVKFSHSDQFLATASSSLRIMERQNAEWKDIFEWDFQRSALCLNFNESDNILVLGGLENIVTVFTYDLNQWRFLKKLAATTEPQRYLAFINQKNFLSVSNNKEIIYWINQNDSQYYNGKSSQASQQIISSNYCSSENQIVLCYKNNTEILKILNNDLQIVQDIKTSNSIAQFSKNGLKLAISSEGKLKVYSRNQY